MLAFSYNEFIIYTGVILFLGQSLGAVVQHLLVEWNKFKLQNKIH